jgi:ATP/maltotriose-dependent transcriptional regulator MalT
VLAFNRGDVDLAEDFFEETLAIRQELGHQRGISVALHNLGEVALHRGDVKRASTLLEDSMCLAREQQDAQGIAPSLLLLGEIARLEGDLPRAGVLLRDSLTLSISIGAVANSPRCFEALARLAHDLGTFDRAARLLAASDAHREELGQPLPPIDWPPIQRTRSTLRHALGPRRFDQAWVAGRSMPRAAALDYALAPAGPVIRLAPEPESPLSQRERVVAMHIARGLTNRQIASELVVSQRTVEAHCRNIFDKLSVTSRTQVATWAVTSGLLDTD